MNSSTLAVMCYIMIIHGLSLCATQYARHEARGSRSSNSRYDHGRNHSRPHSRYPPQYSVERDEGEGALSNGLPYEPYDFSQPNEDWVFLLDRTVDIGRDTYIYNVKHFVRNFLDKATHIHPDFTRVSVISFARDMEIEFDHIRSHPVVECQMFSPGGLMEKLDYTTDPNYSGPSNLYEVNEVAAFSVASEMLKKGRLNRHSVTQRLWLVSDGTKFGRNAKIW